MDEENVSQTKVNKVVRALAQSGPLKYTVRIFEPDGSVIEFQVEKGVKLEYNDADRHLWLVENDYPSTPICRHEDGMFILQACNPV